MKTGGGSFAEMEVNTVWREEQDWRRAGQHHENLPGKEEEARFQAQQQARKLHRNQE